MSDFTLKLAPVEFTFHIVHIKQTSQKFKDILNEKFTFHIVHIKQVCRKQR